MWPSKVGQTRVNPSVGAPTLQYSANSDKIIYTMSGIYLLQSQ